MYDACELFKLCSVISIVQRIFYKNTTKTFCKELLISYLMTIKYSIVLLFEMSFFYSCSMILYIQSFKLHSLTEFILLRYRKLRDMVNIRTSSLFQTSRSLILVFALQGGRSWKSHIFIRFSNQFKVSQAVFRGFLIGFLIDFRNDTKCRVHRLYTRALYRIPFHLKGA